MLPFQGPLVGLRCRWALQHSAARSCRGLTHPLSAGHAARITSRSGASLLSLSMASCSPCRLIFPSRLLGLCVAWDILPHSPITKRVSYTVCLFFHTFPRKGLSHRPTWGLLLCKGAPVTQPYFFPQKDNRSAPHPSFIAPFSRYSVAHSGTLRQPAQLPHCGFLVKSPS